MKMNKKIFVLATLLFLTAGMRAQVRQEAFFLRNDKLSFRQNPAFAASQSDFIGIGEGSFTLLNNVGAAAFLYPVNGTVVTGLNPKVSAGEFLGNIPEASNLTGSLDYDLATWGFARGDAFHTFDLAVKGSFGAAVSKDIFEILKTGNTAHNYDLSSTMARYRLYAELAYGYSRNITGNLAFGVRAKLLYGLGSASYFLKKMNIGWTDGSLTADVESHLEMPGLHNEGREDEYGYHGPAGAGLAADLGLTWEPLDGLLLSLSATDLGGLFWFNGKCSESKGTASFTGLQDVEYEEFNGKDLSDRLKEIGKEFLGTVNLKQAGKHIDFEAVPLRANAGVKYELPFYRNAAVGAVYNYTSWKGMPYQEVRGGVEVAPVSCLDLSASLGTGSFGMVYGVAGQLNVHKFRIQIGLQGGFCGLVPYRDWPLGPRAKTITAGLTYDI